MGLPSLTKAQADRAYRGYRNTILRGLTPLTGRSNCQTLNTANLSDGTNTSANYRYGHPILVDGADLRLLFVNHYNGDFYGPNPITVKAAIEYPTVTGVSNTGQTGSSLAVFFGGVSRSVTIEPGGFALSDPIPITVAAGQTLYTRTYVSVASAGMKWPVDLFTDQTRLEGATKGAPTADLSSTGTLIAQTTESGYGPALVVGVPAAGRPKCVALSGDSILYGSGDSKPNGAGFAVRALTAASIPYVQLAIPGERIASAGASEGVYAQRMRMGSACTHALEEYARNDWGNGGTLAALQADKLRMATYYARRGIKVFTNTSIPSTTSTDGWVTVGAQTTIAGESVRVALNAWIRAGLPIDPATKAAVAIGTGGALTAGNAGHPYVGWFETADRVETARDSGKWKPPALIITDAAMTSGSQNLTSASSSFLTTATNGQTVVVAGAGAAGGLFASTIGFASSNTTLVLPNAASTTVSGATAGIGTFTGDGTHPTQDGHLAMAAGIDITKFV